MSALLGRKGKRPAQGITVLNTVLRTSPPCRSQAEADGGEHILAALSDLVDKDLDYVLALAQGLGLASPILAVVWGIYADPKRQSAYTSSSGVWCRKPKNSAARFEKTRQHQCAVGKGQQHKRLACRQEETCCHHGIVNTDPE